MAGGDAGNEVHVGFIDFAQELAGVSRKAFDVTSLSFGENRVERQRGFSRARQSGNDHQLVVGDADLDIFEVVDPGSFDVYFFDFIRLVSWQWVAYR